MTMRNDKIDVIAFQEHNVHRQDTRTLETHKHTALSLGYKLFLAPTATNMQIGGTAILVAQSLLDEEATATFSHSHPKGNSIRIKLAVPTIGNLDLWSIYAPADSTLRRDCFLRMAPFVKPNSILMGDFNCVEDIALDTRRSSITPYDNAGADILTYISVLTNLQTK
eukprot:6195710-Pleurochrysis_carterae.AAC.1